MCACACALCFDYFNATLNLNNSKETIVLRCKMTEVAISAIDREFYAHTRVSSMFFRLDIALLYGL